MNKIEIAVDGKAAVLDMSAIGPRETGIFRKATGFNLMQTIGTEGAIDFDTVCALWWFARFTNGEAFLSYNSCLDVFPTVADFDQRVTVTDVGAEDEDADEADDTPLASDDQ